MPPKFALHTLNLYTASETQVEEIYAAGLLRPRGSSVCHVISFQYLRSTGRQKSRTFVKYWEIIADNPSKAGWSWGYVSAIVRTVASVCKNLC